MSTKDRLLNVRQVAEILSVCTRLVWRDVKLGKLPPPVKYGNATRWKMSQIQKFIDDLQPKELEKAA